MSNRKAKMPDTQISEDTLDIAARAVYAVSVRAIEPALGIPMCKFEELPERDLNLHRDYARAALEAALSGHVVVPRDPTQAMIEAGWDAANRDIGGDVIGTIEIQSVIGRSVYRAMIQAAPPVPEMEG